MTEEKSQQQMIEERMKKNAEEKEKLESQYDGILKEMEEKGYDNMSYTEGDEVTIPGKLFASFIDYIKRKQQYEEQIHNSLAILLNSIEIGFTDTDQMVIELMTQHIKNCDAGNASTKEEVEKEASKEKIKKKED